MSNRWRNFVILGVVLLSAVGLGAARWARSSPAGGAVRFVPEIYEYGTTPVFSGDRFTFDVSLVNDSREAVRITAIPRTCGCLTVLKDSEFPVTLPPGGKMPIGVQLGTEGKTGPQEIRVTAEGTTDGGRAITPPTLTIRGHIWASVLALPEELNADIRDDERDRVLTRTVELADEWPGKGLDLAQITSTAGDRMTFELAPAAGRMIVRGLDVTRRAIMTVRYRVPPGASAFDETITITPKLASAKPATLKLRGRILPDFEFQPSSLVFYRSPEQPVSSRLLTYRYSKADFKAIRPLNLPEGLKLEEIAGSGGQKRFRITSVAGAAPGKETLDLSFAVGEGGKAVSVPVTIMDSGTKRTGSR